MFGDWSPLFGSCSRSFSEQVELILTSMKLPLYLMLFSFVLDTPCSFVYKITIWRGRAKSFLKFLLF